MLRTILMALLLLHSIDAQQSELVAGHVVRMRFASSDFFLTIVFFQLYRHGDRTPIQTFPSDPYQEKDWPNG